MIVTVEELSHHGKAAKSGPAGNPDAAPPKLTCILGEVFQQELLGKPKNTVNGFASDLVPIGV